MRRVITAREQYEMRSPWRTADTDDDSDPDKKHDQPVGGNSQPATWSMPSAIGVPGGAAPSSPSAPSDPGTPNAPTAPQQTTVPQTGSGLADATALAQGASGNPYDYGGAGHGQYDCSGFQSDIYNALTGKPEGHREFSTTSDFGALGFQPGFDPNSSYNIGVNPAPGMSGHMVGELNGVNVESGGAADKTQYGGQAAGPQDKQFTKQYHLPNNLIVKPGMRRQAMPPAIPWGPQEERMPRLAPAPEQEMEAPPERAKRVPQPQQQALIPQNQVEKVPRTKEPKEIQPHEMPWQDLPADRKPAPRAVAPALPGLSGSHLLSPEMMEEQMIHHYNNADEGTKAAGADWYDTAGEYADYLAKQTNRDPKQVAAILSAFSPQTGWTPNMAAATHFLHNYDPRNPNALDAKWPGLGENMERAKRVHAAGDENGYLAALQHGSDAPKITNFYKNIAGDKNAVTVDSWMARALLGQHGELSDKDSAINALGWAGGYDKMSDAVRSAAGKLGITPRELQATVWSHVVPTAGDYAPKDFLKEKKYKEKMRETMGKPIPDYTHGPGWESYPQPTQPFRDMRDPSELYDQDIYS